MEDINEIINANEFDYGKWDIDELKIFMQEKKIGDFDSNTSKEDLIEMIDAYEKTKDWKNVRGDGTIFYYMNHYLAKTINLKENRKKNSKVDVKKSLSTVLSSIRLFLGFLERKGFKILYKTFFDESRSALMEEFVEYIQKEYTNPSTKRNHYSAVKNLLNYCLGNVHINENNERKVNIEAMLELLTQKLSVAQRESRIITMEKKSNTEGNTPETKSKKKRKSDSETDEDEETKKSKKKKSKNNNNNNNDENYRVDSKNDVNGGDDDNSLKGRVKYLESVCRSQQLEINQIRNHYILLESFVIEKLSNFSHQPPFHPPNKNVNNKNNVPGRHPFPPVHPNNPSKPNQNSPNKNFNNYQQPPSPHKTNFSSVPPVNFPSNNTNPPPTTTPTNSVNDSNSIPPINFNPPTTVSNNNLNDSNLPPTSVTNSGSSNTPPPESTDTLNNTNN